MARLVAAAVSLAIVLGLGIMFVHGTEGPAASTHIAVSAVPDGHGGMAQLD